MGRRTVILCRKRKRHPRMRSLSRPRFECLERWDLSYCFLPSLVRLWSLQSRKNHSLRHLRGRYQSRNRNRRCAEFHALVPVRSSPRPFRTLISFVCSPRPEENLREPESKISSGQDSPYDVSIQKQCLRFSNAPRLRVTLGEYPELGVDKRSGGERILESFLHWDRDVHGWGCGVRDGRIVGSLITRGSGEAGFLLCLLELGMQRLGLGAIVTRVRVLRDLCSSWAGGHLAELGSKGDSTLKHSDL